MLAYPDLHLGLVDATIVTIAEHADTDQIASLNGQPRFLCRAPLPHAPGSFCSPKASSAPPDRHQPDQFCKAEEVLAPVSMIRGVGKHASGFFGARSHQKRSLIRDARRCSARSARRRVSTNVGAGVGCGLFLNNRHDDPSTGAFLSVDPLLQSTGTPYLYAGGNPTTYSDPTGF